MYEEHSSVCVWKTESQIERNTPPQKKYSNGLVSMNVFLSLSLLLASIHCLPHQIHCTHFRFLFFLTFRFCSSCFIFYLNENIQRCNIKLGTQDSVVSTRKLHKVPALDGEEKEQDEDEDEEEDGVHTPRRTQKSYTIKT